MIKSILTFLFLISITFQMKGQFLPVKFSTGIVQSDLHLSFTIQNIENHIQRPYNTPKTGFYFSLGSGYQFFNWFQLQTNLTYQERLPLETFHFPRQTNGFGSYVLPVPTSPQSQGWDAARFNRLPNFKYLYLELVPMFNFSIKKITIATGAGIYFGLLRNHRQLVFTGEDFPEYSAVFSTAGNTGEISYEKYDLGWMPKLEIFYLLNSTTNIGISAQSFISHSRLINDVSNITPDDDLFDWDRNFYTTWIAHSLGVSITHQFNY